eukprot:TRINITY_DN30579_c0_g1_i1.p1 TRINITY_DN30579_c0_g1~~TRINITY_DN30579_c0_g1_i1.p1  ORF type:complete len:490 (-),score=37.42 TRINITY_DN30579_c0_g1_i1:368-1792(-)
MMFLLFVLVPLISAQHASASDASAAARKRMHDPPSPHCLGSTLQPLAVQPVDTEDIVAKFGIITDVHYADAPAKGTRHYRDSLPKVRDAVRDINSSGADFLIELGDFKDDDAHYCRSHKVPSEHCKNITIGFLDEIEEAMAAGFPGPRYHILGNHDVDVLTQAEALAHEKNTHDDKHPISSGNLSEGYFSFVFPFNAPVEPDTSGCLVHDGQHVWVIHPDGTRTWLSAGCDHALHVSDIEMFTKRRQGQDVYSLNASASVSTCSTDPSCTAGHLPHAAKLPVLRFITLNADFTDKDVPWADLDGPDAAVQGMSWDKANVPTKQLSWLASELQQARSSAQRVIVFAHYRLDGGAGGPVSPPSSWVDACTLQNAAVVRALLEEWPGLVLAVFSGHDHIPHPPYTKASEEKPLYFTHAGLIEGAYSEGHNAYSVVSILRNCSIIIRGWANQGNATIPGPPNCKLTGSIEPDEASIVV